MAAGHAKARTSRRRSARSVPALYGALTAGLLVLVLVVASVVSPATPPSIAELSPSARERIEEARAEQGIGRHGGSGSCAQDDIACIESQGKRSGVRGGSKSGAPSSLEVSAGRRCYGDPPRQTEDPQSPPCVFEIFKGHNGGRTAPGVTASEIRVALPWASWAANNNYQGTAVIDALIAHFNSRYEFYGRRLRPVFVEADAWVDPAGNKAAAEDILATKPFAAVSRFSIASNSVLHQRLAEKRVVSVVARAPGFDSDALSGGLTWTVEPPLDVRLGAAARFAGRALEGRPASHGGPEYRSTPRRFAVVVVTEGGSGVRPDPGPLVSGLSGCGAELDVFETRSNASQQDVRVLALELKRGGFTTVIVVASYIHLALYDAARDVGYFPEWMDFGMSDGHEEATWAGGVRQPYTAGHASHAFGITPEMRVRPEAEMPAAWALRDGGHTGTTPDFWVRHWYEPLLVLASGIQGAGPNLTPETFAQALHSTQFPNPNPGAPPYWQQGVGFGLGDFFFHDDYTIWWWNENARSQTGQSSSGRGSFCYLGRGARFTPDTFPTNADSRLFNPSESCR